MRQIPSSLSVTSSLADAELVFGEEVPTGTYLDMTANLPVVDPAKVLAPVMIVRGEHDGISSEGDLLDFFRQLPNSDRQFVVLPGRRMRWCSATTGISSGTSCTLF